SDWWFRRTLSSGDAYDIYHATGNDYVDDLGRLPRGCRRVLTVHDMIHEVWFKDHADAEPAREAKRRAVEQSDLVICVSQATKRDMIRILGTDESKIRVIYHANPLTAPGDGPRPVQRPYLLF